MNSDGEDNTLPTFDAWNREQIRSSPFLDEFFYR